MKKILIVAIVLVALGLGWWLASPLFIDREIDEALPTTATQRQIASDIHETGNVVAQIGVDGEREFLDAMETLDMPDTSMEDPMPVSETFLPIMDRQGAFAAVAHRGSGDVSIVTLEDGSRILRFEGLDVDNGPDLRVLLSPSDSVQSSRDLGEYVEIGKLKGNKGNQNYALPADLDVSTMNSVVIYCKPFHVVFNSAELN